MIFKDELWCSGCGDRYYIINGCTICRNKRLMPIMARKTAQRLANGEKILSRSKRARKALYSRILNLLLSGEDDKKDRGIKMALNLKEKSPARYGHLKRLYKARTR